MKNHQANHMAAVLCTIYSTNGECNWRLLNFRSHFIRNSCFFAFSFKKYFFKARRKSRIPHGQCDTKFRQYLPHKNNIWHRQRQGVTQHVGAWPGDAQSIGEIKLDKLWDLSLASLVSQRQAEWHHLKIRCHSARGKDKKQARTKHKKTMKPNYTKAKCAQGLGKGGLQMEI